MNHLVFQWVRINIGGADKYRGSGFPFYGKEIQECWDLTEAVAGS
jgi:hypothetical protein